MDTNEPRHTFKSGDRVSRRSSGSDGDPATVERTTKTIVVLDDGRRFSCKESLGYLSGEKPDRFQLPLRVVPFADEHQAILDYRVIRSRFGALVDRIQKLDRELFGWSLYSVPTISTDIRTRLESAVDQMTVDLDTVEHLARDAFNPPD